MHYLGIVLPGEHEPRASHVGGQLVDLVELICLYKLLHVLRFPEVEDEELVCRRPLKLVVLDVDAEHKVSPLL